ncbi:unnamed protein product, partial [Rotaria sp. Silwood2]
KSREFICRQDGDCIITYKYRRLCNCCRLAKCFRVGMKKSLILSDEKREARNKLVAINRLKRGQIPKPQWLIGVCIQYIFKINNICLNS